MRTSLTVVVVLTAFASAHSNFLPNDPIFSGDVRTQRDSISFSTRDRRVSLNNSLVQRQSVIRRKGLHSTRSEPASVIAKATPATAVKKTVCPFFEPSTARLMLVACAALYGSNYPVTKLLQTELDAPVVTALRFIIATLVFLPYLSRTFGNLDLLLGCLELGFWCGIGFISQGAILEYTSASKAAFFCSLSVVMPPILDLMGSACKGIRQYLTAPKAPAQSAKGSKSTVTQVAKKAAASTAATAPAAAGSGGSKLKSLLQSPFIAPILALCGAAVLACGGIVCDNISWNDLSLLITPFSFAMCFWRAEQIGRRHPTATAAMTAGMLFTTSLLGLGWTISSMLASSSAECTAAGGNVLSAVVRSARCLFSETLRVKKVLGKPALIAGLLYTGLMSTALTSYAEQQALRVISASETTLIYSLEPLFATAFAFLSLGEEITTTTVIGAAFILLGCVWGTIFA